MAKRKKKAKKKRRRKRRPRRLSKRGPAPKVRGRPPGLNARQERFVQEYLIDMDAKNAAIRAGYAATTAESKAPGWVKASREEATNVYIWDAVRKSMEKRAQKTGITAERIMEELAVVGLSDIRNVEVDNRGKLIVVGDDDSAARAVSQIKRRIIAALDDNDGLDDGSMTGRVLVADEIKHHDKIAALKLMGEHLGMYLKRKELSGSVESNTKVEFYYPKNGREAGDGNKDDQ
jgi:phage terminase small subunit